MTQDREEYLKVTGLAPGEAEGPAEQNAGSPEPERDSVLISVLGAVTQTLNRQSTSAADEDPSKLRRKAALERAHDIRKFEIELYWKRANYFWLLQAAVFAAVGLTWKTEFGGGATGTGPTIAPIVPIALSGLGVISSCAGWRASLGSKFWQRNWEHHVDMLEGEFEGHLYKTVYVGRDGTPGSVSGISESLSFCFFMFWMLLLLIASCSVNQWDLNPAHLHFDMNLLAWQTFGVWFATAIGVGMMIEKGSKVSGERNLYPQNRLEIDSAESSAPLEGKPHLIRREPSIK